MKRALIAPLVQAAYTIYSTPSEASPTEKATRFAGFVAHQAAAAHLPPGRADTFSRLAAEGMLALVQNNYHYSSVRAQKTFAMQQAKLELEHSRTPWAFKNLSTHSTAITPHLNHPFLLEPPQEQFRSQALKQHKISLEQAETIYPRAFCVAFLAFERASKTKSKKQFENSLTKELMRELAEPFSFTGFLLEILRSKEMRAIMGVVLFLGLILIALPTFELSALSASTTYAIGGSLTLTGGIFHLWRACAPNPKAKTDNEDYLLLPSNI